MSISLNQFAPNTPVAGMYVYMANLPQLHNCLVAEEVTVPLKSGDIVVLNTEDNSHTNTNCPVVTNTTSSSYTGRNGYQPLGVVTYNPVINKFVAGDRVSVARAGDIVWMPADGAIGMGQLVFPEEGDDITFTGRVTATFSSDLPIIGVALTTAAAENDLIQVELKLSPSYADHT